MRAGQRLRKWIFPVQRRIHGLIRPDVFHGGPPAGIFSEVEGLRDGNVKGQMASRTSELPTIPEDSPIRRAGLQQHRHGHWPMLWTHRSDVLLAGPSLVHIDQRGYACIEAMYGTHCWADPVWKRHGGNSVRNLSGNHTSLVSRWNDGRNYFHWFMDGLTRLVHLGNFPDDCRIIIPANLPPFARRSLEILSLSDRVVETSWEDLRVGHYWFAGPTMLSGCPDPVGVFWLRDNFLPEETVIPHRRLYLERVASSRNLLNKNEVRVFFATNGWEVINPADFTLDEQISLFRQASSIAAPHGAALTNLLWAPKGARVIELMPNGRRNGCYAGISLILELEHQWLICPSDRRANITADLRALEKLLASPEADRHTGGKHC